jgi:hypothetical protein
MISGYLHGNAPIYYGLATGIAIVIGALMMIGARSYSLRGLVVAVLLVAVCMAATHATALHFTETRTFSGDDNKAGKETMEVFNEAVIPAMIKLKMWRTSDPYARVAVNEEATVVLETRPYRDGEAPRNLAFMIDDFVRLHRAIYTPENEIADYIAGDLFSSLKGDLGHSKACEIMADAAKSTSNAELKRAFEETRDSNYKPKFSVSF